MPATQQLDQVHTETDREERRPVALKGWLVHGGREERHEFLIDNLSYGGCRLQSPASLSPGEEVHLYVLRRGAIPGTVRWRNAYGIGVVFATDTHEKVEKPRKVSRVPLQKDLAVRQTGRRARVLEVSDLSRFGCCVTFEDQPFEGEWVWVTLPGLEPVEARIRWVENRRAGVEFVHPLHDAVFNLLLIRWGMEPDAPGEAQPA